MVWVCKRQNPGLLGLRFYINEVILESFLPNI